MCGASCVILILTLLSWYRSRDHYDFVVKQWVDPERRTVHQQRVSLTAGSIHVLRFAWRLDDRRFTSFLRERPRPGREEARWEWRATSDPAPPPLRIDHAYQRLGFDLRIERERPLSAERTNVYFQEVRIPHWFVAALSSMAPGVWLSSRVLARARKRRRVRREMAGQCPSCGYDMRGGGGTDPRCPECGTPQPAGRRQTSAAPPAGGPAAGL